MHRFELILPQASDQTQVQCQSEAPYEAKSFQVTFKEEFLIYQEKSTDIGQLESRVHRR